jgi:hypothetical protein
MSGICCRSRNAKKGRERSSSLPVRDGCSPSYRVLLDPKLSFANNAVEPERAIEIDSSSPHLNFQRNFVA